MCCFIVIVCFGEIGFKRCEERLLWEWPLREAVRADTDQERPVIEKLSLKFSCSPQKENNLRK